MALRKQEQSGRRPCATVRPAQRKAERVRQRLQYYLYLGKQRDTRHDEQEWIQQEQIRAERQMARLRADAVQAHRLAGRIPDLAHPTHRGKRMSDPVSIPTRRKTDPPAPGGSQLRFNPLHPSMELPPEQLIRLLGLADKKRKRRRQPRSRQKDRSESQRTPPYTDQNKGATSARAGTVQATTRGAERERDTVPPAIFGESRWKPVLRPAIIGGIVLGVAASLYLFWGHDTRGPIIVETPAPPSAPARTVQKPAHPPAGTGTRTTGKVQRAIPAPPPARPVVRIPATTHSAGEIAARQAALEAAARERFDRRLSAAEYPPAVTADRANLAPPATSTDPAEPLAAMESDPLAGGSSAASTGTPPVPATDAGTTPPEPAVEQPEPASLPASDKIPARLETGSRPGTPDETVTETGAAPEVTGEEESGQAGNSAPDLF
ncbi:MAG TPA: hypothetical protein ENJ79_07315 [Gammaproteobacteria bacterium]|nr:hypothetical protein [Gammaproteobacteria bacterium]